MSDTAQDNSLWKIKKKNTWEDSSHLKGKNEEQKFSHEVNGNFQIFLIQFQKKIRNLEK